MDIISRAQWGAKYGTGFGDRTIGALDKWLHHTAMSAPSVDATFAQDAAAMRAIEKVGQQRFGRGISYTFVVMPSGRVFEGHPIGRIGAHTNGRNTTSASICLHGNYQDTPPTPKQERSVADLLNFGVANRYWRLNTITGGHRNVVGTACPGNMAFARIDYINWLADNPGADSVPVSNPVPVPEPAPAPLPDNGAVPAPDFPLQGHEYFGWKAGPKASVSGFFSHRSDLKRWQQRMADRGWKIDVDGYYGPNTNEVTVLFQREKGLVVDGRIGPATWAAAWTAPIT